MKYSKNSKAVILMSIVLLVGVISAAMVPGCSARTAQSSDITYKNEIYGFSVNLPKAFADAAEIKEDGNIIYFVNKEIQEENPENIFGVVGRIEVFDKKEYTREEMKQNEDAYNLRYLGENENYYFAWAHATDVQIPYNASEQLKEEFRAMEGKFEELIKTFKISEDFNGQINLEELLSYIIDYDEKTKMLTFDEIEWVDHLDTDRVNELGLDAEYDFPNGFYIHNESEQKISLKVSDNADVYLVNLNDSEKPLLTDLNGLSKRIAEYEAPYLLTIQDNVIVKIFEQYIP